MDWPIVLALVLAIPLILFSAVFGYSINVMGIRDRVAERRLELTEVIHERRVSLDFIVPLALVGLAIYSFLIWLIFNRFASVFIAMTQQIKKLRPNGGTSK